MTEHCLVIAAERASLKRASEAANLIYVYGENLSQTTVYAVHCGRARSEMRDELFTLRLNLLTVIIQNTYLPLPLLWYRLEGVSV